MSVTPIPLLMPIMMRKAERQAMSVVTLMRLRNSSDSSMIRFRPSIAIKGMVNSAMTRILSTVRNFAYIGTWSMKKSVKAW